MRIVHAFIRKDGVIWDGHTYHLELDGDDSQANKFLVESSDEIVVEYTDNITKQSLAKEVEKFVEDKYGKGQQEPDLPGNTNLFPPDQWQGFLRNL